MEFTGLLMRSPVGVLRRFGDDLFHAIAEYADVCSGIIVGAVSEDRRK
jgi:hypothetical protein